ncbi:MAG: hypothetical protein ACPL6C_02005, partial [bacterium]
MIKRERFLSLIALFLSLFVLSANGNNTIKKSGAQPNGSVEFSIDKYIKPEREIVEERTATGRVYAADNGTMIAEISTRPIHYRNSDGKWVDIQLKIRENNDITYPYANTTNELKLYFPASSKDGIKGEFEKYYFKWQTLFFTATDSSGAENIKATAEKSPVSITDSLAVYKDIFPFGDEEFVVLLWGVEQRIILREDVLSAIDKKERMVGIAARVSFSDGINLVSSQGELGTYWKGKERLFGVRGNDTIFVFEKPIAYDSRRMKIECDYEWKFNNDELLLFVKFDAQWLVDSSRGFPVVIDPEVYLYSNTTGYTGYVGKICSGRDWLGNCNAWSYTKVNGSLWCGSYSSHDDEYRGWAMWSTSSIPDGSTILDTQVRLYSIYTHFEGGNWTYIDLYQMSNNPYYASATTIFDDAYDGTQYASMYCTSVGVYYTADLGSNADSHLRSQLPSDWFAIGGKDRYAPTLLDEIDFAGSSYSSSYQPRLYVSYINPYCNTYSTITVETPCYQTVSGSIGAYSWRTYQFSAKQGNTYRFSTCDGGGSAGFDTYLYLYNSSCDELANDDDGCGYPLSRLDWIAPSDGTNYISVRGFGSSSGSYTMAYRIQPTIITPTTSWNTTSGSISSYG